MGATGAGQTPLPVPALDHVVVNARDRLDEARDAYERLGFTLTPRGHHTLGSINHLAVLGTDYLELVGVAPGKATRADVLAFPRGLNGFVFGTEDADATFAALANAGVGAEAPLAFSRPVDLPGGRSADARFRTVHVGRGQLPFGRLYFCEHATRNLIWRDEWRHHANGAVGVLRAVVAAEEPGTVLDLLARMFGEDAVRRTAGGGSLGAGLTRLEVVRPEALRVQFGEAAPEGDGRPSWMAALALRTLSLDQAAAALHGVAGAVRERDRILVPAVDAMGVAVEFRE